MAEAVSQTPPSEFSSAPSDRQVRYPLLLVLLFAAVFYLGNYNGIWNSNDGSHFALVQAIAERGMFELGPTHLRYTLGVDVAVSPTTGRFYSDRPPGTALLLTPFYLAGMGYARFAGADRVDRMYILRFFAAMGILALALANVALVYWAGRLMAAPPGIAALGALIFATAGLALKYSTLMFSHTPSVTTALLGACLLLAPIPASPWRKRLMLAAAGLVMGYAVAVEYQNALFSLLFFVAWTIRLIHRKDAPALAVIAAGAAIPAISLAAYHYALFGRILASTHTFNPMMEHNRALGSMFSGSVARGLYDIFLRPGVGVLLVAPVLVSGAVGLGLAARRNRAALAPLVAAMIFTAIIASHTTILGGATRDCRYFFPVASLLALGLAPLMASIATIRKRWMRRSAASAFAALAVYSAAASFYFTVNQKLELEKEMPPWKAIAKKYATVTSPDHNIDRQVKIYLLPRYGALSADYLLPLEENPAQ